MNDRAKLLEILRITLERLKEYETSGRVGPPSEITVQDGLGFSWPISPEFKLIVCCLEPTTRDGALIRVGVDSSLRGIRWVNPPDLIIDEQVVNPECRYPQPPAKGNLEDVYFKILKLIDRLVEDPLSE
jgi:hypothetical protein